MRRVLLFWALIAVLVPAGALAADRVAGNGKGHHDTTTTAGPSPNMLCADCGGGGGGTTTTTPPPPPPPPPTTTTAPPPPPTTTTTTPNYNGQSLSFGGTTLVSSTDILGPTRTLTASGASLTCATGYHLKTRVYAAHWSGSILGGIGWKVQYQACYLPNSRIVWAAAFPAFSASNSWPVNWDNLNDSGYPTAVNAVSSATFRWQGTANSCVLNNVFCTRRHPGTQIVFYPNNTESRSGWGG